MAEKEELETRLYERMSQENEAFLADLKTKPADEIIRHAYEIACKDNLLMLFEDETGLTPKQLEVLLEFEHPLAQLYDDWINRDTDEMDNFRSSIESYISDRRHEYAERKYHDPAEPMYSESIEYALANEEYPERLENHKRNRECAMVFGKETASAYHANAFPAFLQSWGKTYGKERCMFILAYTIKQRYGDRHIHRLAQQAAEQFPAQIAAVRNQASEFAIETSSRIVNLAMEHFARPERGKAQEKDTAQKKKPQMER